MNRLFYTFTFICLLVQNSYSQVNKDGIPFITNYSAKTYKAAEQNWAVVQDKRGVMYFGNNDNGILEYDGVKWRKIPIKNGSIVRSLAIDDNGIIYVGAVGDFGYLQTTKDGQMEYKSLVNQLDTSIVFADVWKTYCSNDGVYFCVEGYVFKYNNKILKTIKSHVLFSFLINNTIYSPSNKGLFKLKNNSTLELISEGKFYADKSIFTMDYFKNKILMGTNPNGFYYYNPEDKKITKAFNSSIDEFVKNGTLYQTCIYDSSTLFLGTLYGGGALYINSKGKIINNYNKNNGLQDETIISFYKDDKKNIWLSLNNGIAKIEQNSPFKYFSDKQGIRGYITSICEFKNKMFISTSRGVFYRELQKDKTPKFIKLEDIKTQTWSLLNYEYNGKKLLLIGTIEGLYVLDENFKVKFIDKDIRKNNKGTNYIQKLYRSKKNENEIFVATSRGVFTITYNGKKWNYERKFDGIKNFDIRHVYEDSKGNVWFASFMNGVIKSINGDEKNMVFYSTKNGIPSVNQIYVNEIDNKVSLGTEKGIFTYNEQKNTFEKDANFEEFDAAAYFFEQDRLGNIWVSAHDDENRWVFRFEKDKNNKYTKNKNLFKRLPNEQVDAIFYESNGLVWFGTSSGLYSFNNNYKNKANKNYNSLIRRVITENDSVLFNGTYFSQTKDSLTVPTLTQKEECIPELSYKFNNLVFEYAATWFVKEEQTKYSYMLEGYDETWRKWTSETKAVFTNLGEGKYTFKVKAKNIFGEESTIAKYSFEITPPFYRTLVAFIIYVILGIFIVILIIKIYTRRLEQEKIRLEEIVKKRTAEILEQKEEIEKQKEEITASIQYALRIQRAIVPSEEEAQTLLKNYFLLWKPRDIVSGDFWWMGEKDGYVIVTAADCTGHGVPGAFMSMLGVSFLNEIVNQQSVVKSGEILNRLRDKVKNTLGQTTDTNSNKDGMDIALLVLDFNNMKAQFSGAYNPLYVYRNGELLETKATRNPIAVYIKEKEFEQTDIELQKGDTLYVFSDGFPDQFGGEKGKKYSTKRFKQFLLGIQDKTMAEQREILDQEIEQWRKTGNIEQIDDIIVLGIRI